MPAFLVITGMILWMLLTFGLFMAMIHYSLKANGFLPTLGVILVGALLFSASGGGFILVVSSHLTEWFGSGIPVDGCYLIKRTPVPGAITENAVPYFSSIPCPGGR
jgi:vacuolar-type H+-ATPase subunit I/STV1